MDQAGLLTKILFSVENIDFGRKCLATDGREHEGRLFYEDGISAASTAFQEASNRRLANSKDPQTLVLAELAFLQHELHYCDKTDTDAKSSLTPSHRSEIPNPGLPQRCISPGLYRPPYPAPQCPPFAGD
jgi:hypothetical protein